MFTRIKHKFNRFRRRGEVGANPKYHAACVQHYMKLNPIESAQLPTGTKVESFCGKNNEQNMYMNSNLAQGSKYVAAKYRHDQWNPDEPDNIEKVMPEPDYTGRYDISRQSGGSKRKKSRRKRARRRTHRR